MGIIFLFILITGNVRARRQQISFSGKIVYCRTPSEAEKAATDILHKIERMKAPGQVSLGFDLEWRPFPRRGLLLESSLYLNQMKFGHSPFVNIW